MWDASCGLAYHRFNFQIQINGKQTKYVLLLGLRTVKMSICVTRSLQRDWPVTLDKSSAPVQTNTSNKNDSISGLNN